MPLTTTALRNYIEELTDERRRITAWVTEVEPIVD